MGSLAIQRKLLGAALAIDCVLVGSVDGASSTLLFVGAISATKFTVGHDPCLKRQTTDHFRIYNPRSSNRHDRFLKYNIRTAFSWVLAAFFVVGASANTFASQAVIEDYQRWGYPGWFHYLTGFLECLIAVLLFVPKTRLVGLVLGGAVMAAAAASVSLDGGYAHALPPLTVLALLILNVVIILRARVE